MGHRCGPSHLTVCGALLDYNMVRNHVLYKRGMCKLNWSGVVYSMIMSILTSYMTEWMTVVMAWMLTMCMVWRSTMCMIIKSCVWFLMFVYIILYYKWVESHDYIFTESLWPALTHLTNLRDFINFEWKVYHAASSVCWPSINSWIQYPLAWLHRRISLQRGRQQSRTTENAPHCSVSSLSNPVVNFLKWT